MVKGSGVSYLQFFDAQLLAEAVPDVGHQLEGGPGQGFVKGQHQAFKYIHSHIVGGEQGRCSARLSDSIDSIKQTKRALKGL
jgi:hypothetical protein